MPQEVFLLLETIYHSFDKIAKKRKVFKVRLILSLMLEILFVVIFYSFLRISVACCSTTVAPNSHETAQILADRSRRLVIVISQVSSLNSTRSFVIRHISDSSQWSSLLLKTSLWITTSMQKSCGCHVSICT